MPLPPWFQSLSPLRQRRQGCRSGEQASDGIPGRDDRGHPEEPVGRDHERQPAGPRETQVQSTFLKADTRTQMITVEFDKGLVQMVPRNQVLKIKLEVDTDPPPGFSTEIRYLLRPIPFAVRTFSLPDFFAGKMHAVLCREWKSRVKGRDWYDLVWFAAYHPELHVAHLEQRMRQTEH